VRSEQYKQTARHKPLLFSSRLVSSSVVSTECPLSRASGSRSLRSTGRLSPLQLESKRRDVQKSTGPRTRAGKYRSALTGENRRPPEAVERVLPARDEDPRGNSCAARPNRANPSEPDRVKAIRMSGIGHDRRGANPTGLCPMFPDVCARKLARFWKLRGLWLAPIANWGLLPASRVRSGQARTSEAERTRQG